VEVRLPHRIVYETDGLVSVADVIESLQGADNLLRHLAPMLEGCVPGVTVESIGVSVQEISQQSPLKELLLTTLVITFQNDLTKEVPKLIDHLFGAHVSGQYDSIVTILFCLLLFYSVDYLYRQLPGAGAPKIKRQLDGLVREVARECGIAEDKVRDLLQERYSKGRLKSLVHSTLGVFAPSKRQANAPLAIGNRHIDSETVASVPNDAQMLEFEEQQTTRPIENADIELHAQDIDRTKTGWAAVVKGVSDKRLRMELYPPIKPEHIYTKQRVRGDIVLLSRPNRSGEMEPYLIYLVRLRD
jgi:hypothetical protein